MAFEKVSPHLVELVRSWSERLGGELRTMFGCPVVFVNGHMCLGAHEDRLFLRVGQEERAALEGRFDEVEPFDPKGGRPMREYVSLPEPLYGDEDLLAGWATRAGERLRAMPPKRPRPRRTGARARRGG